MPQGPPQHTTDSKGAPKFLRFIGITQSLGVEFRVWFDSFTF